MRITKATVVPHEGGHKAHVSVIDEGVIYYAEADHTSPRQAVLQAAGRAAELVKAKMMGSIDVKSEVVF